MGRSVIVLGLIIAALGAVMMLGDKIGIRFGRLPGDIKIEGKNTTFYFPLATSLLASALLSLVFWFLNRQR